MCAERHRPCRPGWPPGPPGSSGASGLHCDPNLARRVSEVERFFHQVCLYLGISASGTPVDTTRLLDEFFRLVAAFEADSLHDAAVIKSFRKKTDQKAATISALQKKVEQLKSASLTQLSVALAKLQDDINDICRDLDRPCSEPPHQHATTPQPLEEEDAQIYVVGAHITSGSFKPTFKEKYTLNEGSITSFLYVYESAMEEASDRQRVKHSLPV